MLAEFIHFVKSHKLFDRSDSLLVAVSGGKDSVCLAHLLSLSEYNFTIAHCNFKLRGKESDEDALFVKQLAKDLGVNYFEKVFDTAQYAEEKKLSIQEAARNLRYNWFRELKEKHGFSKIVTAHHQEDSVETFFINLFRSSGISGLTGIPVISNDIVRPLLFASRSDIDRHIQTFNLNYREDSSNITNDYLRNKIRHELIPIIQKLDNRSYNGLLKSIEFLKSDNVLFQYLLNKEAKEFIKNKEDKLIIDLKLLKQHPIAENILFKLLKPYGFHKNEVAKILKSEESGKIFYSHNYRAALNRNKLIISKINEDDVVTSILITEHESEIGFPLKLNLEKLAVNQVEFNFEKNISYIDADKIKWPLELRKWQYGDSFVPLGMKGRKKVSDFLIDEKVSILEKENTWVLLSNNEIVWLVGHRISDKFKITDTTQNVLKFEILS
jgi:tRNA(Ile)-lysidine synthase